MLYPVASEQTLSDLVKEYRRMAPPASCLYHFTRLIQWALPAYAPALLDALDFRANTATHRPIIHALAFIKANRDSRKQHFTVDGTVPLKGSFPQWRELVLEQTEWRDTCEPD